MNDSQIEFNLSWKTSNNNKHSLNLQKNINKYIIKINLQLTKITLYLFIYIFKKKGGRMNEAGLVEQTLSKIQKKKSSTNSNIYIYKLN